MRLRLRRRRRRAQREIYTCVVVLACSYVCKWYAMWVKALNQVRNDSVPHKDLASYQLERSAQPGVGVSVEWYERISPPHNDDARNTLSDGGAHPPRAARA